MIEQMIYEESPLSFDEIIDSLKQVTGRINNLDWKFKQSFPIPKK